MNEKYPLVSVIIPTYNRNEMIKGAIDSALNQSYTNLEVIVVDDGSTDNTRESVETIEDDRLKYIRHAKNKGANAARNTGLEHSGGKLLSFLDSDVVLLPNKIEKQVVAMQNADDRVGVIYGPSCTERGGYIKKTKSESHSGDIYSDLLSFSIKITTSTMLIKRECFENVGKWDPDLPSCNEYDFCLRVSKRYDFKYLSDPLIVSRGHDQNSITNDIEKRMAGIKGIIEKWGDEMRDTHGQDTVNQFVKRSKLVSYREASVWNAMEGNRIKGWKLAYQYLEESKSIDTRFLLRILFASIGRRSHGVLKKIWFRITGEKLQIRFGNGF